MTSLVRRFALTVALSLLAAEPPVELPPELPWDGASRQLMVDADDPWVTPSERTGLTGTPRYDETMAWLARLVDASKRLKRVSLGRSAEGRDIWMVIASLEGADTPERLRRNGRPTLLAHAGIHAGEIDGKDAGLMLLRDITVRGTKRDLLEGANFLFIPILSVDGHERFSAYGRINQHGPREMGWRTNRRNLNLNRDFAKLETEEVRSLVRAIRAWQPDLYLDLHVTDGADYQYDATYGYNHAASWSPRIADWIDDVYRPFVDQALEREGHVPGPLVFATDGRDPANGNLVWTAPPRFSNGWGDARHLATVLLENHSLKPYPRRVLGTYVFLEASLRVLAADTVALREATSADRSARRDELPLGWRVPSAPASVPRRRFRGVRSESYLSEISGASTVRWTGEPIDLEVPFVAMDEPTAIVRRPAHYYIPAAWYPIADRLRLQGIEVESMPEARTLPVEVVRLPEAALDTDNSPFEGRAVYVAGALETRTERVTFPPGSFRVTTDQPLGTLAVLLLEPRCPDSLFAWGYFGEILQRTEYFEAYVLEPTARRMMEADPELAREFERRVAADPGFAGDPRARLEWFYRRLPFYDQAYRVYPVARSVD